MKKFQFRLQTILNMKQKNLDEKLIEFSKLTTLLNQEQESMNQLLSEKESILNQLNKIFDSSETIDIPQVSSLNRFLPKNEENIQKQKQIIDDIQKVLDLKNFEIQKLYKETKVLEKFKEKTQQKYYKHFEQLFAKELDDIASTRYNFCS